VHAILVVKIRDSTTLATNKVIDTSNDINLQVSLQIKDTQRNITSEPLPFPEKRSPQKITSKLESISKANPKAAPKPNNQPLQQRSQKSLRDPIVVAEALSVDAAVNTIVAASPTEPAVKSTIIQARPEVTSTKSNYLAQLLLHIEKHKYYPAAAKRRGIQGSVDISFWLSHSGEMQTLRVEGDNKLLRKAAEKAVMAALPFPSTPPESLDIVFSMNYALQ